MSEPRVLATYLLETPVDVEHAAERVAGAHGVGAVEAIRSLPAADAPSLVGRCSEPTERWNRAEVDVSLPLAATGGDLLALTSALLGDVFDLDETSGLRLLDFTTPPELEYLLPGPAFGMPGTRAVTGVQSRPLIGSIIKPSVGLTPDETADRVRELGLAGIDFVKDDELMTSPRSSPLSVRVRAICRAVEEVAESTGRRVMFAFNVSSDDPDTMSRNHDAVVEAGGTCVMVSLNQVGLGAFLEFRRRCVLPIHGHRNGWGMLTRSPGLGMDFRAYQRIWRLAGTDQLHCNGFSNKFFESDESVARSVEACLDEAGVHQPILPVLSSGQWGGQAPATYRRIQTVDLLYLAGGGIQGHPGGIAAGVEAVRAAWSAAVSGEPLEVKARACPPLAQAIEAFGGPADGS